MTNPCTTLNRRSLSPVIWTLRVTVLLACVGIWDLFIDRVENPFLHWLLEPVDIGGLNWDESTALALQSVLGWSVLAAGACVAVRPYRIILVLIALLQLLIAVATWRTADGYPLESSWVSPRLTAMFPFTTHLLRIAAPAGLMLLTPGRGDSQPATYRPMAGIEILKWATAVTFFAHGVEALQHSPEFIDYLIATSQRLVGVRMPQPTADFLLTIIGLVDMVAAVLCVATRWRSIWCWMAFWGAIAAASRITSYGFAVGWHAALIRAPHAGVPLALALCWSSNCSDSHGK